jgi:hypothetical protein
VFLVAQDTETKPTVLLCVHRHDSENEAFSASVFSTKSDKGEGVLKESSNNLATEVSKVTQAAPKILMQNIPLPLVKANSRSEHSYKKNSCGASGVASGVGLLELRLLKTKKWAANQSGVVGRGGPFDPFDRVGTPRLASNSPAQDPGGSLPNMCVMPSAVCLQRDLVFGKDQTILIRISLSQKDSPQR